MEQPPPPPPYQPPTPPGGPHQVAPVRPDRLNATARRELGAPIAAARAALLTALRQAGLTITSEQLSVVEAERSARFGGLSHSPEKMPLAVRADLDPAEAGSLVELRVEDRWKAPIGRNWGAVSVYRETFEALAAALDRALAQVDATAATRFEPWTYELGDDGGMRGAGNLAARAHRAVGRSTDRMLQGRDRSRAATAASGLTSLDLATPTDVVRLDAGTVDGVLTTGLLVVARPSGLPPNLLAEVQRFVIQLEEHLEQLARMPSADRMSRLELTPDQVPVVAFLFQQSRLREQLPLRLLMRCTTCRLEKIVNPDLTRLRERSRRSQALTSSMGMMLGGRGGLSPYVMLGRMTHAKNGEPDFVCPRCQGLDADECVVTFCPQCGERRDESVLRTCPKCDHDFRALDRTTPAWEALPPAPPPPPVYVPPAVAAAPPRYVPPPPFVPPPPYVPPAAEKEPLPESERRDGG